MATIAELETAALAEQAQAPLRMGNVRGRAFDDGKAVAATAAKAWATAQDVIDAAAAAAARVAAGQHGDQRGRHDALGDAQGVDDASNASDVPT